MSHDNSFLDLNAHFVSQSSPTPFGTYDTDTSFRSDADSMIKYIYTKLGGNVLQVELKNKDVYACFEEASLEYSTTVNTYHAKSLLADIVGSATGSLAGQEQKIPRMSLSLAKKRADAFASEAMAGGTKPLHSSSITLRSGQQVYNLQTLMSSSGVISGSSRVEIKEIFHFSPTAAYRFFDTNSAVNYLHNQFSFESFTPETVFYLLPVWEDVLRAQMMETSHRVRRSNFSYNIINNELKLYPQPTEGSDGTLLFFTYYLNDEPAFDNTDSYTNGVSNLSNVPFGNISYSKINSIGKQWIKRFALSLSKELLGQIRSKVADIPIPNGSMVMNGPDLIAQAREEQMMLREDLKIMLESTSYTSLIRQQQEESEALMNTLAKVPLPILVGNFLLFFYFMNMY